MNLLWITYLVFPEANAKLIGQSDHKVSGGWMLGLAEALVQHPEVHLSIASPSPMVDRITAIEGTNITYYIYPKGKGYLKYNCEYEPLWRDIVAKVKPDVVHIHGTEYNFGLTFLTACSEMQDRTAISLQGMPSAIAPYFHSGISLWKIIRNITFRDILRWDTIHHACKDFEHRGEKLEIPALRNCRHIIGRTTWDKAHSWAINPHAQYHFCNEILREEFYSGNWIYDTCEKNTLFISQAGYALKGLHFVLKALPLILQTNPNVVIRIAGPNILRRDSLNRKLRFSGYAKILRKMIKKYHLENHVQFLGPLNAEEMKRELLRANLYLCPSTIENSPNSLGEAQMLGVPCVASYVGGVADMIPNKNCGTMYRFDDVEMLAYSVVDTLVQSATFDNAEMKMTARLRHDPQTNVETMLRIYQSIDGL